MTMKMHETFLTNNVLDDTLKLKNPIKKIIHNNKSIIYTHQKWFDELNSIHHAIDRLTRIYVLYLLELYMYLKQLKHPDL